MSFPNNRTFIQKHGLKIVGVVVVLTVIIGLIWMFTKNEEEEKLDLSPSAKEAIDFLQDTDQSDIDGAMGTDLPEEEEPPASGVETYMIVPGNKPPLDYTRITSSSSW